MLLNSKDDKKKVTDESGPIRTQVCLRTEQPVKQTNKQYNDFQ